MTQLLQSYLFAYLFWLGIALGSYALLAMHGLTGGKWGDAIRTPLLAAIGTIPLLAVLFLPLLFGVKVLYHWDAVRAAYLNVPFFAIRAVIYFAIWSFLALIAVKRKCVPYPGPSLLLYVVTMTFASWDWMMSLEPKWWSTIYAMNVITGQALAALAAMIAVVAYLKIHEEALPDLGNLLLANVMFWAYLVFSQFLIIWSGNTKEEISWYLSRMQTSWRWLAVALIVIAFFAPFLMLMFRSAKRSAPVLLTIACIILVTRLIEICWTITPAFHPEGFFVSWADPFALLVLGAIWLRVFRRSAQRV